MVYTLRGKEAKKFLKKMKQKEKSPIGKDDIDLANEIAKIPYKNKPKDYPFHNKKRSWEGYVVKESGKNIDEKIPNFYLFFTENMANLDVKDRKKMKSGYKYEVVKVKIIEE